MTNYAQVDVNLDDVWGDDPGAQQPSAPPPAFSRPHAPGTGVSNVAQLVPASLASRPLGLTGIPTAPDQLTPKYVVDQQRQFSSTQDLFHRVAQGITPVPTQIPPAKTNAGARDYRAADDAVDAEMAPPPTKRLKHAEPAASTMLTDQVNESVDLSSQFSLDAARSTPQGKHIPGPAGALPSLRRAATHSGAANAETVTITEPPAAVKVQLRSPSKMTKKKIEDTMDFRSGPWLSMLQDRSLPPFGDAMDGKLKYNIKYILEEGFRWKTPELVVLVKAVRFDSDDAKVTLRDPSGDMDGTISRQTIEEFPDLQQGAVLVLKDVACFSPKQSVHHLIITEANVSKLIPSYTSQAAPPGASRTSYVDIYCDKASLVLAKPAANNNGNLRTPERRHSGRVDFSALKQLPPLANVVAPVKQTSADQDPGQNTPSRPPKSSAARPPPVPPSPTKIASPAKPSYGPARTVPPTPHRVQAPPERVTQPPMAPPPPAIAGPKLPATAPARAQTDSSASTSSPQSLVDMRSPSAPLHVSGSGNAKQPAIHVPVSSMPKQQGVGQPQNASQNAFLRQNSSTMGSAVMPPYKPQPSPNPTPSYPLAGTNAPQQYQAPPKSPLRPPQQTGTPISGPSQPVRIVMSPTTGAIGHGGMSHATVSVNGSISNFNRRQQPVHHPPTTPTGPTPTNRTNK